MTSVEMGYNGSGGIILSSESLVEYGLGYSGSGDIILSSDSDIEFGLEYEFSGSIILSSESEAFVFERFFVDIFQANIILSSLSRIWRSWWDEEPTFETEWTEIGKTGGDWIELKKKEQIWIKTL
jgi:hypothetical protein